jgi:alkyl hydroperoxide reductase subunit AhpC
MSLRINDTAPDFTAHTTHGDIRFHDWLGDSWGMLFSHPKDFTPVCTTELGRIAAQADDFARRNCKMMGLSVDSLEDHRRWQKDIEAVQGAKVDYPIIADSDLAIAKLYNMLPAAESGQAGERTAANNATVRSVFIIAPDKTIRMMLTYPMTTGRNFDEILRVLDSIQLTMAYKVATPANWKQGEDVIIAPSVSDEDAHKLFPKGFKTIKPYLRTTPQPGSR